jgi:hypothetical protein
LADLIAQRNGLRRVLVLDATLCRRGAGADVACERKDLFAFVSAEVVKGDAKLAYALCECRRRRSDRGDFPMALGRLKSRRPISSI